MRASRGLKWENKMYKLKRSIVRQTERLTQLSLLRMYNEQNFHDINWFISIHNVSAVTFKSIWEKLHDAIRKHKDNVTTTLTACLLVF